VIERTAATAQAPLEKRVGPARVVGLVY